MALETLKSHTEKAEVTLEKQRDEAWSRFEKFIDPQCETRGYTGEQFEAARASFARAHLDVLIDMYDPETELQPYEFIRDKILELRRDRGLTVWLANVYFDHIRRVLTNIAAMRVISGVDGKQPVADDGQILKFYEAVDEYVELRTQNPSVDALRDSEGNIAHTLANRLVFQAANVETLCSDPYEGLNDTFTKNNVDENERGMTVAAIANRVTTILIADIAKKTEKRPRKPLSEPVVSSVSTPPAQGGESEEQPKPSLRALLDIQIPARVEDTVAVQRHDGYIVFMAQAKADDAVTKGEGKIVEVLQLKK